MFKKRVTSEVTSPRVSQLDCVGDGLYEGKLVSYGGREYDFAWDKSVGLLWAYDAAESILPESPAWHRTASIVEECIEQQKLSVLTDASRHEQSIRVDNVRGKLAKGSPRREIGFTRSRGITVYYALDQAKYLTYYKKDDGPVNPSPESINADIIQKKNSGDTRKYVAIVEGAFGTLAYYQDRLTEPEIVIYLSDEKTLKSLGIQAVDIGWEKGRPQIDVNQILASRFDRESTYNPLDAHDILTDDRPIIVDEQVPEETVEALQDILLHRKPTREIREVLEGEIPSSTVNRLPETTELVEIIKRQKPMIGSRESVFVKESPDEESDDVEDLDGEKVYGDDDIAKRAQRFLAGKEDEGEIDESN